MNAWDVAINGTRLEIDRAERSFLSEIANARDKDIILKLSQLLDQASAMFASDQSALGFTLLIASVNLKDVFQSRMSDRSGLLHAAALPLGSLTLADAPPIKAEILFR